MSRIPLWDSPCCPPQGDRVTWLTIGARKTVVGLVGLETVFQQLYALGRSPTEVSDAELIGMVRRFNYIPRQPDTETDYAIALREAYAHYWARQTSSQQPST